MKMHKPSGAGRAGGIVIATILACLTVLAPAGCRRKATEEQGVGCTVVELRPDLKTGYYDAVVRVEWVGISDASLDRMQVLTPSQSLDLAGLTFSEEAGDPDMLEAGDIFIVPLKRPDWKLDLGEGNTTYCFEDFWDRLPQKDQWHPTKTEAMTVARSLAVVYEQGIPKPVPAAMSEDWILAEEVPPTVDSPMASAIYQKVRNDRVVDQVQVQYTALTEEEKALLATTSAVEFLSEWSECARTVGREVVIAAHPAVACDLEGEGDFGWTYRYFYVDFGLLIAVDVQSDPLEWGKTEEEKEAERRSDSVYLRYGYGPTGPEQWEAMIELRTNRTGAFHKMSRAGETVDKDFTVTDAEFSEIQTVLAANNFMELQSRSGGTGGQTAFIAVRSGARAHTVEMKNYKEVTFENIVRAIRRIILPKVGEKAA